MINLDFAATTPLDARVLDAMLPYLRDESLQGNPASTHAAGLRVRAAIDHAREQVAALIKADAADIIWTSGATESNNLAIKGALEFRGLDRAHVVTSRTEHKCVLDTCRHLETRGVRVTMLKPGPLGLVTPEQVIEALTPQTVLVSLMWVNNEIGNVQDIERLAPLLRQRGVLLHVDAAQAIGRIAIDLQTTPVDLLSLSAHKAYGPKGIGALFVRRRPRARLAPQLHGGGHEQGMRSGTLATHQIVGMGAAFEILQGEGAVDAQRQSALRERLWNALRDLPGVYRNGDPEHAAPHILNLSFENVEGESLRAALPDLAVSSGSACSSVTQESSYVLRALGRDDELANASLRFSFGRSTTEADIDAAASRVRVELLRLRGIAGQSMRQPSASEVVLENVFDYSAPVWQRFLEPAHGGTFGSAVPGVTVGRAGTSAARHWLALEARWVQGRVAETRFSAYGCPTSIAVGDWIAQWSLGRSAQELRQLDASRIGTTLEIPEDRAHCGLMGEDALRALLAQSTAEETS